MSIFTTGSLEVRNSSDELVFSVGDSASTTEAVKLNTTIVTGSFRVVPSAGSTVSIMTGSLTSTGAKLGVGVIGEGNTNTALSIYGDLGITDTASSKTIAMAASGDGSLAIGTTASDMGIFKWNASPNSIVISTTESGSSQDELYLHGGRVSIGTGIAAASDVDLEVGGVNKAILVGDNQDPPAENGTIYLGNPDTMVMFDTFMGGQMVLMSSASIVLAGNRTPGTPGGEFAYLKARNSASKPGTGDTEDVNVEAPGGLKVEQNLSVTGSIHTRGSGDDYERITVENETSTGAGPMITLTRIDSQILSDDTLGGIGFYGSEDNGVTKLGGAGIVGYAGTAYAGNGPAGIKFYTSNTGGQNLAMTLDGDGNLSVEGDLVVDSGDALIGDDRKLYFGRNFDASIEYDEDSSNELIISAPDAGIFVTGSLALERTPTVLNSSNFSQDDYWLKVAEVDWNDGTASTDATAHAIMMVVASGKTSGAWSTEGIPKTAILHVTHQRDGSQDPDLKIMFLDKQGSVDPWWDATNFLMSYETHAPYRAYIYVQTPQSTGTERVAINTTILAGSRRSSQSGEWKLLTDQSYVTDPPPSLGDDRNPEEMGMSLGKLVTSEAVTTDLITNIAGSLVLESSSDIDLDADGGQVRMKGTGGTYLTFNVDGSSDSVAATGDLTLDVSGDINLDSDDGYVRLKNNGSNYMSFDITSAFAPVIDILGTLTVQATSDIILDADGGQIYMKDSGTTYLTFNVDGTTDSIEATGNLKLEATGDITLDPDGGQVFINNDAGSAALVIGRTSDLNVSSGMTVFGAATGGSSNSYVAVIRNDSLSALSKKVMQLGFEETAGNLDTGDYFIRAHSGGSSLLEWSLRADGVASQAFTGMHYVIFVADTAQVNAAGDMSSELEPGMIVESTGDIWNKRDTHTHLPKARKCVTPNSKAVFGVMDDSYKDFLDIRYWEEYSGTYNSASRPADSETEDTSDYSPTSTEFKCRVNSVGDGAVWVTDIGGNIENGDYITSSEIGGYGQLQSDDIMRNYTVAKCTESVDWSSITDTIEHNGQTYKKCLVGCTYHCG